MLGAALAAEESEGSPEVMLAFERLLYSIRRDLGHANKGLGRGDLLRTFINDVDEFLVEPVGTGEADST
jgi:hypothetical protein